MKLCRLRSLKKYLHEWGFGRNLTAQNALAALWAIKESGYSQQSPPPDHTQFMVRGMLVSFPRVAEYYRRKGINDSLSLLEGQDFVDPGQYGSDVPPGMEEMDCMSHTSSNLTDFDNVPGLGGALEFEPYLDHSHVSSPTSYDAAASGASVQLEPLRPLETPSLSLPMGLPRSPKTYHTSEYLIYLALTYGSSYRSSARAMTHEEPAAYGLTETGQFGHLMQDGLSALLHRSDNAQAWDYFNQALAKTPAILLKRHSPMSLAQVYAILCELENRAREQEQEVVKQTILRKVIEMLLNNTFECDDSLENHICKQMFAYLSMSQHVMEDCLKIMSCLVDTFEGHETSKREQRPAAAPKDHWKRLFLIERYCDCLYHAHHSTPRQSLRAWLFEEQKRCYGGLGRTNVLWTLSNVADDELDNRHPQRAGELFTQALRAAFGLQDAFARAKVQFAALKGLSAVSEAKARLLLWRPGLDWEVSSGRRADSGNVRRVALEHLDEAERCRKQAEEIAASSFGPRSRRAILAADRRRHLERLSVSIADL